MKPIRFSVHALAKLEVLARHGWRLTNEEIEAIVKGPDRVEEGYKGRRVAQKTVSGEHVLRVVFEEHADAIVIVTMYPGRRTRYDKD